jgi:hypothetical protein
MTSARSTEKMGGAVDDGDIGVPMVGRGTGDRVEVEDLGIFGEPGQRGVAQRQRAEARGEGDLLGRPDRLVPQEDHPVGQKRLPDPGHVVVVQVRQVHPGKLCTDATGQGSHPQPCGSIGVDGHDGPPQYLNSDGLYHIYVPGSKKCFSVCRYLP